jgi:alkylation response protein AidB-like acyl-CoA dehydrogenase
MVESVGGDATVNNHLRSTRMPELDLGPNAAGFRGEIRAWLEANAPDDLSTLDLATWTRALRDAGYLCVSWPKEYGGRGLTGIEVAVMNEEFARARVPRVTMGMGEALVGPAIILHGSEEQKAHFLPRIINGDDVYCQGFSEPDSGSDLASLKTRGIVDGDEVIVTGQKVWTSGFYAANMMFCLCRTDPDVPKHQGISYVLIPLRRDDGEPNGIEFRGLKQLTGESHFAESFLTEARAPVFNVIGGLNHGWKTAMTTLGNERGASATTQHVQFRQEALALIDEARARGKADDPRVRQQLAWAWTNVEIMRFRGLQILSALAESRDPGPSGSINKVFWSEYQRRMAEIALDIVGPEATTVAEGGWSRWQRTFLVTRSHTIWGGTAEIQRNILGEKVLGLPKDPGATE